MLKIQTKIQTKRVNNQIKIKIKRLIKLKANWIKKLRESKILFN